MDEMIPALIYSWGPIVFFALVLAIIVKIALGRGAKSFSAQTAFMQAQADNTAKNMETMRNISATLERIATALEKRS